MRDYLITITVKNNVLLRAMKDNGFKTAASLSRASGVCQETVGGYLNLKQIPFGQYGELKESILKIAKVLRRLPEDLFPEQHIEKALNKNKVSVELDTYAVKNILDHKNPEKLIEFKDMKAQINLVLSTLRDREREVIEHRFGLNGKTEKTLRECSEIFGIQRARVLQLEQRGLRFLRIPKNTDKLRDCLEY